MSVTFLDRPATAGVPIHLVDRAGLAAAAAAAPAPVAAWLRSVGFDAAPHSCVLVPDGHAALGEVWVGVSGADDPWALAGLPLRVPEGNYRLAPHGVPIGDRIAALSWTLGGYEFDAYKRPKRAPARLSMAATPEARRGALEATAIAATRDLVNTPAEHMGPAELAAAVKLVAAQHGATFKVTVGDALLKAGFPAIHTVGRAATRAPRLIELTWGQPRHPRLTLIGKGVCFDSGGLDLKTSDGMRLMKKDMGGAANALGLAALVMACRLPVRLQLLIPAVENAVAGNAYRPGDVIRTRKGLHIEIGNTDAEGRVVLCDAIAYAAESRPDLIIDLATLTGAARVALGGELPALFCRNTALARDLVDRGLRLRDPLWHLPLWQSYHASIESDIADIVNTGRNGLGGAITAALFLEDFVPDDIDWMHIDLYAWNPTARPGRPVGGEAQTIRTLLSYLEERYRA